MSNPRRDAHAGLHQWNAGLFYDGPLAGRSALRELDAAGEQHEQRASLARKLLQDSTLFNAKLKASSWGTLISTTSEIR